MGQRCHQDQPGDRVGMVEGQRQGHRATEGMPQHQRSIQAQRLDKSRDLPGLGRQVRRRAGMPGRIARARPVERDDPEMLAQLPRQGVGQVATAAHQPVNHHQRWALALVEKMKALAIDVHKAPVTWNGRFDAPCHPGTEAPCHHARTDQHTRSNNPFDSHSSVLCFPAADRPTGIDQGLSHRPHPGPKLRAYRRT